MKLVATTLSANSEDVIGPALESVKDWVDECLLIDTGITDGTVERARRVVGDKLVVQKFRWCDDFSAARNYALARAMDQQATWAVTVDTDERIDTCGDDIRARLASSSAAALRVYHRNGEYQKERFFRIPCEPRWFGPVHEAFRSKDLTIETMPSVCFDELMKTPEQLKARYERDLVVLAGLTRQHPDELRWRFYLGDTLDGLGRTEEAIASFDACAELDGWRELSAWACFRSAECRIRAKQFERAVATCAGGLARHAGIAELAWLAGWASFHADRYDQAIAWAASAVALGCVDGLGSTFGRIGFRKEVGLYEGPFDVLRHAYRKLGRVSEATQADAAYERARQLRHATMR